MEGLLGLLGEGTAAVVIAVILTLNIVLSAVTAIFQAWGKSLDPDSGLGKIVALIQGALDWLSANVAHKKK